MQKEIMEIYFQVFERTHSAIEFTSPAPGEQNNSINMVCYLTQKLKILLLTWTSFSTESKFRSYMFKRIKEDFWNHEKD